MEEQRGPMLCSISNTHGCSILALRSGQGGVRHLLLIRIFVNQKYCTPISHYMRTYISLLQLGAASTSHLSTVYLSATALELSSSCLNSLCLSVTALEISSSCLSRLCLFVTALGSIQLSFEYNSKRNTFKVRVWQVLDLLMPPREFTLLNRLYHNGMFMNYLEMRTFLFWIHIKMK